MEVFTSGLYVTIMVAGDVVDEVGESLSESLATGVESDVGLIDSFLEIGVVELGVYPESMVTGGHEFD